MILMLRKELRWFAKKMERKLRKHDLERKMSWKYENQMYLYGRLMDEIEELHQAIGLEQQIEECLDIANFAMMLANNLNKQKLI